MSEYTAAGFMLSLNSMMVIYTLWVISLGTSAARVRMRLGAALLIWLMLLHWGLSSQSIFPANISGVTFLLAILSFVGAVGAVLFSVAPVRRVLLNLSQEQLLLAQGIRVFFGAGFLMQASLGNLPRSFGILDGWTHIAAGFLGLVAAFSFAKHANGARRAWFANIFGLADILIVATSLALVLLPQIGPHHSMMYAVFLPAPLWLWFHVLSLRKLVHARGVPDTTRTKMTIPSSAGSRSAS
ncbi:MAG: hypothetical protein HY273_03725 [Gammaproteobacteria bacterium]|nr:hypothetical protein [Gammaproteobacteria bacterium]